MALHYQEIGGGKPIVILHGLLGSSDNWKSIAKALAVQGFKVISVDLRNHGRSAHSDVVSYHSMAMDVYELFNQLGLTEVVLIGHSVGGKVAMKFDQLYPGFVQRMIVVDIAPKAYQDKHSDIFAALRTIDLTRYHSRNEVSEALASRIPDRAVRQFLLMNLNTEETPLSWRINLPALADNYPSLLQNVCETQSDTPTCFIRGGQSDYILDSDLSGIKVIYSNVKIITVEKAGHWVHAEAPKEFLQHTIEYLNDK
jgi:pimeloyl-ACP methyl ester carboxylesterase